MDRKGVLWGVLWMMLGVILVLPAHAGEGPYTNTIMHPDRETRLEWIRDFEAAPPTHMDRAMGVETALRGSLSLLSHLKYTPSERDQGACGNCWAWAGTGVMGIALDVEEDVFDRLSVQLISLCNTAKDCCDGGWLSDLSSFYSFQGFAIPWSNDNAGWRNGGGYCNGTCESISISPDYPIQSISTERISTHGVGQAQAISNIKNLLNQNRAVWFAFFMGTQEDWDSFYSFWNTREETALWNFDSTCDKPYTSAGGGHAVLCVGYNDNDPENGYWIMLNSWGTTAQRPNGLFRVDMNMNYDCMDATPEYNLFWQTLNIEFDIAQEIVYVEPSAWCGGHTPCYSTIQEAINAAVSTAIIRIAEGRYPEALTLNNGSAISLEGGWDAGFTTQSSSTTIDSLSVVTGTVAVEYIHCQ